MSSTARRTSGPARAPRAGGPELGALLVRVSAGDGRALAQFYDRTAPRVFGVVCALVAVPSVRERVLEQAYLRMWRDAASFAADRDEPLRWAMRIACREAARSRGTALPDR